MSQLHSLILGVTNSGKTTMAKMVTREFYYAGQQVFVVDKYADSGWYTRPDTEHIQYKFSNYDLFFAALKAGKITKGLLVVDEAATLFDEKKDEMNYLLMMGRHLGLRVFLLAQRYLLLPPNARNNVRLIYSFNQCPSDTDKIKKDYPRCIDLSQLNPFEYVALTPFSCSEIHTLKLK